jgi:2'-5' RNA ligase
MKLAVVAYPNLDEEDRQWIEGVRRIHDPQADRIGVHFTLVFPCDAAASNLEPEVQNIARRTQSIRFAIRHAKAIQDKLSPATHVVLVPGDGAPEIERLHDQLYAGRLRVHLRPDIPFIPHMTVATVRDSETAERLASEFGSRPRVVRGTISRLHLIDVENASIRTVRTYSLDSSLSPSA